MPNYRVCYNLSSWLLVLIAKTLFHSKKIIMGFMVEKLSMRPFSFSLLRYYLLVFIRRTIYICSRLCYRPLSLTEIFLLYDMKKENAFLC